MTKLKWEAANRRSRWAYTQPQPSLPSRHLKDSRKLKLSAYYTEIASLTQRIAKGDEMIAALPPNDPRWQPWRNHLFNLVRERKRLRSL